MKWHAVFAILVAGVGLSVAASDAKDVKQRHALKLVGAKPLKSGKVSLIYRYGILVN